MNNYSGKTIYIGIDVHKNTYSVAVICDNEVIKKARIKADHHVLLDFIKKFFPSASDVYSAYEAGFSGFGLHRFLVENNINNIVVHAASIEVSSRDRVKTDKRDAVKIATQLAAKRLKGIHVPTKEQEAKRSLTRLRDALGKDKTRVTLRIKHFLHQHGINMLGDENKKVTKKWVEVALEYEFNFTELTYAFRSYLNQWLDLDNRIKELKVQLEHQADNDHLEEIYRSVPGIGPLSSRLLSNELGDMSQFDNEKKLFSFTGLTPCEYSSGEHVRQGHISRQGRSNIRRILILCAWAAIKKDDSLANIFTRIAKKSGCKRAIVAIARRLIGRIRACLNTGSIYQIQAKVA